MKRRFALFVAIVCAVALLAPATPVTAQESTPTVKAAIPPQARPTVARPETAQARPEMAPAPKPALEAEAANVRLDVTISYQVGSGATVRRSAVLTVADQGSGSLRAGNQVAVPSTTTFTPVASTGKPDGATPPPGMPMTSFNYRSVGMNVDARRVYIQGNKAKMDLSIEFSAIDEKPDLSGRPPSFPTFSQNLSLILENGKPLVVAQSSDFVDNVERKQSVEVKATILR
jgi:hypothetical protein